MENSQFITTQEMAMDWWNNLSSAYKTQLCDTNTEIVGKVRRWESLTNREIRMMYKQQKLI